MIQIARGQKETEAAKASNWTYASTATDKIGDPHWLVGDDYEARALIPIFCIFFLLRVLCGGGELKFNPTKPHCLSLKSRFAYFIMIRIMQILYD
jgi:hypothetical protein